MEIDKAGVNIGNAGMLPAIGATANTNNSIQNSSQTRADGNTIELDDALNNNLNYGVVMDWTIFDGFRMFARYNQLKEIENLSKAQLQQTILSKVSDVMITYYDLVQQQQQLTALDSTLVISDQRLRLANNRFNIGKSSKLEVLNAQVDMNTDQTMQLQQQELYKNTKIRLNQILARDTKIEFNVIEEIPVDDQLFLPILEELALEQNPLLQAQVIAHTIAKLELKQVRAGRYPTIVANTGYQFSESESSLGFISFGKSRGWNYGLSARMNIFDGFTQKQNEQISKIQIENTALVIEQQTLDLQSQLNTAFQTYITNIRLIELERNNEAIAKENLEITMEKFRLVQFQPLNSGPPNSIISMLSSAIVMQGFRRNYRKLV